MLNLNIHAMLGGGILATLGCIGKDLHTWQTWPKQPDGSAAPFNWRVAILAYPSAFVGGMIAVATGQAVGIVSAT